MKIISRFFVMTLFLFTSAGLLAQANLEIQILNLKSLEGVVALQLLDHRKETVKALTLPIIEGQCIITINDLRLGTYAVRYFHDQNANATLDTNWLGIPKEGYGFSNDAYGKFGPKDFGTWLFKISGDTHIKLTTKY